MFLYDNNYFPPISDQYVAPFLNESQKKIWREHPEVPGVLRRRFGMMGGVMMNDDPLEDEELREARLAAAKKDAECDRRTRPPCMEMMKAQMKARVDREGRSEK